MSLVYNEIVPPTTGDKEELDRWYEEVSERLKTYDGDIQTAATTGGGSGPSDAPFIVDPTIPTPTTVTSLGAFGTIIISWDDASYTGHSYAEVFYSLTDDIQTAIKIGDTTSSTYTHTSPDLDPTVFNYYWVRFVNKNFEVGLFSTSTGSTVTDDPAYVLEIVKDSIGFQHMAPGEWPVRTEDPLPLLPDANYPVGCLVILLSDGKLYRNVSNVWTAAVEWGDVANVSVGAGDIEANAINANHIQANAITASEIAAGAVNASELNANAVIAGKIAAGALVVDDGVMQNGYIKTALIADATITNAKIATLDAGKINTGTLTGRTIQTSSGTGKRIILSSASNEVECYGYRGPNSTGSIAKLATLGVGDSGNDYTVLELGDAATTVRLLDAYYAGTGNAMHMNVLNGNGIIVTRGSASPTNTSYNPGLKVDYATTNSSQAVGIVSDFTVNQPSYSAAIYGNANTTTYGRGVWGRSNSSTGCGGYFNNASVGPGIYATSSAGNGVEGKNEGGTGRGGWFTGYHGSWSNGAKYGILCETSEGGTGSVGLWQRPVSTTAPQVGVQGEGSVWAFYATSTTDGNELGTGGYGPFTGVHDGLVSIGFTAEVGDILVRDAIFYKQNISNTSSTQLLSSSPQQKNCSGVFLQTVPLDPEMKMNALPWPWERDYSLEYEQVLFNALGEGQINVVAEGGNIEDGDFIVTSSTLGKGMKQSDDILRNYTVAKASESVTWTQEEIDNNVVKQIACTYHCG